MKRAVTTGGYFFARGAVDLQDTAGEIIVGFPFMPTSDFGIIVSGVCSVTGAVPGDVVMKNAVFADEKGLVLRRFEDAVVGKVAGTGSELTVGFVVPGISGFTTPDGTPLVFKFELHYGGTANAGQTLGVVMVTGRPEMALRHTAEKQCVNLSVRPIGG